MLKFFFPPHVITSKQRLENISDRGRTRVEITLWSSTALMFGQHRILKRSKTRGAMLLVEKLFENFRRLSQSWTPITQKDFYLCMFVEINIPWFVFHRVTHVGAHMFDVNTSFTKPMLLFCVTTRSLPVLDMYIHYSTMYCSTEQLF